MKRILFVALGVLAVIIAAIVLLFPGLALELLVQPQTQYAEGFSEERFSRIVPGMSESEVISAIGPPLEVHEFSANRRYVTRWSPEPSAVRDVAFRWWAYAKPRCVVESHEVRSIRLDANGKVVEVASDFFSD